MGTGMVITLVVAAAAMLYVVVIYNGLVALKHAVAKSFANIDVLLKQRHDELPKLVETCRQYMQHEQGTLQKVIEARSRVASASAARDIEALNTAESSLRQGLGQLFALAENYPDLKANDTFLHLQARISQIENALADRRETYNDAVNNNNVRIEQFPDAVVASLGGFKPARLLKFRAQETADVNVAALFKTS
ncbi:MAG: LemA family protein [Spongiibacteraceae bacterium]